MAMVGVVMIMTVIDGSGANCGSMRMVMMVMILIVMILIVMMME